MARLIWTEPALQEMEAIADYIELDNPEAAVRFVRRVFEAVERLARFPDSGSHPRELPKTPYRQLIVPPCRIFYRHEKGKVYIVSVMRSERDTRFFLMD